LLLTMSGVSLKIHRCPLCGLPIKAGFYVNESIQGIYYHKKCFSCHKCKTSLWQAPYVIGPEAQVFCNVCEQNTPELTMDLVNSDDFRDWGTDPIA